jgi:hypothetical protein
MKLWPSPLLRCCAPHQIAWLAALLSGCFHPTFDRPTCSARGECPGGFTCSASRICELSDGGIAPDATNLCFGSFPQICFLAAADIPKMPAVVPADIDTDNAGMCNGGITPTTGAAYCVVAGSSITIASGEKVRAQGGRPLVLLSTSTITIEGTVEVSSAFNAGAQLRGAGGNPPGCPSGTPQGAAAGGGAGGSFGSKGGDGNVPAGDAAGGGVAPAGLAQPPTTLRGGCAGDPGGFGGGAVSLIARMPITVAATGRINASGAGGQGGPASKAGGGGGGSGGMIVFDAPSSIVTGPVFANGGGGGQGGANGGAGVAGGEPITPGVAAVGGTSAANGGSGGPGSRGNSLAGNMASMDANNNGGGGGGGAAGFILGRGLPDVPNIAPPAIALP